MIINFFLIPWVFYYFISFKNSLITYYILDIWIFLLSSKFSRLDSMQTKLSMQYLYHTYQYHLVCVCIYIYIHVGGDTYSYFHISFSHLCSTVYIFHCYNPVILFREPLPAEMYLSSWSLFRQQRWEERWQGYDFVLQKIWGCCI